MVVDGCWCIILCYPGNAVWLLWLLALGVHSLCALLVRLFRLMGFEGFRWKINLTRPLSPLLLSHPLKKGENEVRIECKVSGLVFTLCIRTLTFLCIHLVYFVGMGVFRPCHKLSQTKWAVNTTKRDDSISTFLFFSFAFDAFYILHCQLLFLGMFVPDYYEEIKVIQI